jgi:hypothetical protein
MHISTAWATHLPVLMRLLDATTGPVLELGAGLFSSPYLHYRCAQQGRDVVTLETDAKYVRFVRAYRSPTHRIHHVASWDVAVLVGAHPWAVVLVDQSPDMDRVDCARRLVTHARFLVLHDSQPDAHGQSLYDTLYPDVTYRVDCLSSLPHTTVVSQTDDPRRLLTGL